MQQQQPRKLTLSLDIKTEFPKLTASNSFTAGGMIFYYKKDTVVYGCWEYKSGYKIASFISKDVAKEWIERNIERIKVRLNEERAKRHNC
jgi:hypothetical protein